MSTTTRRAAVDHMAEAFMAALAAQPGHTVEAHASDPRGAWVSSEYPQPSRAPHAATQTPGCTTQPVSPTHNTRTSHPATSTTAALTGRGSR